VYQALRSADSPFLRTRRPVTRTDRTTRTSLLRSGLGPRLGAALLLSGAIWLAILWATRP